MKRIILFVLFFSTTIFSQGIYFSEPTSTHVDYINQGGEGPIVWNFYHSNELVVTRYYARLTYPDGSQTNWTTSDNGAGEIGGWWVIKVGTYQIEGKAWVTNIFYPGSPYWAYRSAFSFSVVDNYAPAIPSNFSKSISNNAPKISWSANAELDLNYYEVWRRWNEGSYQGPWQLRTTTTSTNYVDNGFIINGKPYAGSVYYKVRAVDINQNYSNFTSEQGFSYTSTTWKVAGEEETDSEISSYELFSNYPNPFNPTTQISYQIPKDGFVSLVVYNSLGQEVSVLVNQQQSIGKYSVQFNASNLSSGIYFYKLQVGEFSKVNKMLLVR